MNTSPKRRIPIKLAVFAEYFPPYMGSDYRIFQIMKELATKDFTIYFIVFPPLRALAGFMDESLKRYLARRQLEVPPKGLNAFHVEVPVFLTKLWGLFMPLAYLPTLAFCCLNSVRFLRRIRPDAVVVAHPSYLCGLAGIMAAKLLRLRVILDYPDLWTPMTIEMLSWSPTDLKSILLDKLEGIAANLADHIIAVTHIVRMKVLQSGVDESKITVIPNGVRLREIINQNNLTGASAFPVTPNERIILYSGRLERWAGLESLIKAAPMVLHEFSNSRFVIIGDGTYMKTLENLVSNMDLQDKVFLTGFIKREKVWDLIKQADICVTTFAEGETSDAAFPLKLLEYMALGKPIVATESKAITNFLKDNESALIVEPDDPKSMASAILLLLRNASLSQSLGSNAFRIAKESFDWKFLACNFRKVCYTVLKGNTCK